MIETQESKVRELMAFMVSKYANDCRNEVYLLNMVAIVQIFCIPGLTVASRGSSPLRMNDSEAVHFPGLLHALDLLEVYDTLIVRFRLSFVDNGMNICQGT